MTEIEYDMYTTLANVYDTQDLTVDYDWRQQYNDKMPSSNAQRIGAIAETRFIAECLERDFEPHTPTTPMPWDFIVHCPAGDLKGTNKKYISTRRSCLYSQLIVRCVNQRTYVR
jgi:hypothetical protein